MSKHKFNRPVKPYSIGLDIGTNSIGWSVIHDDYRVPSRKMPIYGNASREFIKKNMMGVLLFSGTNLDGGTPAKKRRLLRGASRRVERKRNRLLYLQEIFFNEMKQVDENFFPRLNESFLNVDDKTKGNGNLFGNKTEESAYYENYPTIYHLRESLANNDEKADLRYIYLALAHILKARGNFLIDDPSFNVENNNIQQIFQELLVEYDNIKGTSLLLNFFKTKVTYADGKVFVREQIERCEDTGTVAWDKEKDMQTVRKTLSLPQVNVVRRVEEQKVGLNGGLFDTNLKSSDVISPMRLVPRKQGLNVVKYGGYQKPTTAYTIILFQKNIDPKIIPVFLLDKKQFEKDPKAFLQERNYLKNEDFIFIKLLKYSLFDIGNGIKRLWASSKEVHKGNEMVISSRSQKLLYLATHLEDEASIKYFKQDRMKEFDTLFEEVMAFAKRTKLSSIHIDKLEKAYAANKETATYEELGASFSEMIKKFVGLGTTSPINNFLGEKLNQKQYTSLKDDLAPCLRGELIYQSITGLYETRVDLKELNNQKGE